MVYVMKYNHLINIHSISTHELEYNKNELRSYLGIQSNDQFDELLPIISKLSNELLKVLTPKACWREVDLYNAEGQVTLDGLSIQSKCLSRNLLNCDSAIIFCATLGHGVDRIINKHFTISSVNGVITNAIGSAYIESYCNVINEVIQEKYKNIHQRFSCGYGDFNISFQKQFLNILNAENNIGVYCTDKFLLIPSKSVTAVIGIKKG